MLGLLALTTVSSAVAAEEVAAPEPPRSYLWVSAGLLVGAQAYFNSGGIAAQVGGGWPATRTIAIEALASVAYLSGGEGRGWASPFEPELAMGSLRVGPRWALALGDSELSLGLHAGYMRTAAHGGAIDLGVAFAHRLSDGLQVGVFGSGIGAVNGYDGPGNGVYFEGGPFIRISLGH